MRGPPENLNREFLKALADPPTPTAQPAPLCNLSQVLPYLIFLSSPKLSSKGWECTENYWLIQSAEFWMGKKKKKNAGSVAIHSTVPKQHTASPNVIAYWPQSEADSSLCDSDNAPNILS